MPFAEKWKMQVSV